MQLYIVEEVPSGGEMENNESVLTYIVEKVLAAEKMENESVLTEVHWLTPSDCNME